MDRARKQNTSICEQVEERDTGVTACRMSSAATQYLPLRLSSCVGTLPGDLFLLMKSAPGLILSAEQIIGPAFAAIAITYPTEKTFQFLGVKSRKRRGIDTVIWASAG
uniref:Uncharacterized protein n=1 Tax=Spironucleus salmonicida TaxID=348837 RepID=V6LEY8_9EUKA|eukprot:EST42833.1 Hypothetical protein SS50377_17518 [Spironucleus salmonicida]